MVLEMQKVALDQTLTLIFHSRANPEIKFYLPQPLWKFGINLVSMCHAVNCYTVLLNYTS